MSSEEEKLPGIHLWLKQVTIKSSGGDFDGPVIADVTMMCEINDPIIWAEVQEKLMKEGLKVYTTEDFKTELMNSLRDELKKFEIRLGHRNQEIAELRHQNQVLRAAIGVSAVGNSEGSG